MKPKSLILMALALGLGLVATLAVSHYLETRTAGASDVGPDEVRLVVAQRDLAPATTLQKDMLRIMAWPRKLAPSGATDNLESLVGRTLRTKLLAEEPVIEPKLAPKGSQSGLVAMIPEGMRAITVKVNAYSGVAGFVQPGSRVDVLMTARNYRDSSSTMTKTILRNAQVLAIDQNLQAAEDETKVVDSVTLLVTPGQAEVVSLAANQGKIRLVLRSNVDGDQPDSRGVTLAGLISGASEPADAPATQPVLAGSGGNDYADSRVRKLEEQLRQQQRLLAEQRQILKNRKKRAVQAESAPPPKPIKHTVEVIQGSEVTQVEFDAASTQEP